ncbi:JAB1/MPN/MOV34 metalloenzyme domain [Trypanosoma melophagium]|uniref:JAB1/MPN/MOV34 metalloenzyme domain n=1 Tax=Trypanosoma melophagium TaxID=715481 RepID=UPI00351A22AC|nr:JAB1/MPN/MOV34 metalloenzyme domain [Trypanosoma melophagium]
MSSYSERDRGVRPAVSERPTVLERVYLAENVVQACVAHALTTEKEEVMGVLLGQISARPPAHRNSGHCAFSSSAGRKWADVRGAAVVPRSVRRADRVEIAATQLVSAAQEAEERGTKVIGWYHSHPRITPYPSHVDLRSQRNYQQLESGWVGLIFSVFYTDATQKGGVSIHCFQTGPDDSHVMVDFEIVSRLDTPLSPQLTCDTTHEMLRVFAKEIDEAVELVRKRSGNATDAMIAARSLKEVQLYTLENLIAQPALRLLRSSIEYLEGEVRRLEGVLNHPQR